MKKTVLILSLLFSASAFAQCLPSGAKGAGASDALAKLFKVLRSCPKNVDGLRKELMGDGMALAPAMVANRGFHNPGFGSFSFFETATGFALSSGRNVEEGEFFFGHFTEVDAQGQLALAQQPAQGSLMVELIAWDPAKGVFNFYEMIGDGQMGQWFYRGDSMDIFADNAKLHLQPNPSQPAFGNVLRCSACHANGGPIMKELAEPNNDWWTAKRPLPLAQGPDAAVASIMTKLVSAEKLAASVMAGMEKLQSNPSFQAFQQSLSFQEQLRPLFCPVEVNFESDSSPLESESANVSVPAAFLTDPALGGGTAELAMPKTAYAAALRNLGFRFPLDEASGGQRADADHAWLAPVKAHSDKKAVASLVAQGVIDEEFAADVRAVDFTNPAFSKVRCELLRLVPSRKTAAWVDQFKLFLGRSPGLKGSAPLLKNMNDPARTKEFHAAKAKSFLATCAKQIADGANAEGFLKLLAQRRAEIAASEISKNPRGQILEPGFRVIFPVPAEKPVPGQLTLNPETCLVQ